VPSAERVEPSRHLPQQMRADQSARACDQQPFHAAVVGDGGGGSGAAGGGSEATGDGSGAAGGASDAGAGADDFCAAKTASRATRRSFALPFLRLM